MTVNMFHYWLTRGRTRCIRREVRTMAWDGWAGNSAQQRGLKSPLDVLLICWSRNLVGVCPFIWGCASLLGRASRETWLSSNDGAV